MKFAQPTIIGILIFAVGILIGSFLELSEPELPQDLPSVSPTVLETDRERSEATRERQAQLYRDHEFSFETPAEYILAYEEDYGLHLVGSEHNGLQGGDEMFIQIFENPEGLTLEEYQMQTQCADEGEWGNPIETESFVNEAGQNVFFSREYCGFHFLDQYFIVDGDAVLIGSANYFSLSDQIQTDLRSLVETLAPLDIHDRLYPEL